MSEQINWPPVGTVWLHYKGVRYVVLGHVYLEASGEPAVVYQQADNCLSVKWVRSVADWHARVQQGARFERVLENLTSDAFNYCEDCPPYKYPNDAMRCLPCPRRT